MAKKNVVWWTALRNALPDQVEKYGGFDWFEQSRKTWEFWCKKNDVIFVPYVAAIVPPEEIRPNYQKAMFVFEEIERMGIDYDKIWMIDSASMIKWDCPNIFNLVDDRLVAWKDMDNLYWVYKSIQGYKSLFDTFDFDMMKYINSGNMIVNKKHRDVFMEFRDYCYKNMCKLIVYEQLVGLGTEQTPMNYWLQTHNIEMNLTLPDTYNLTHIQRKQMFGYNWQLNEDTTPFFIKYGNVWRFNGIPKDKRTDVMRDTWKMVKNHYDEDEIKYGKILDEVEHRDTAKYTTSRKFKKDVLKHFEDKSWQNATLVELGCSRGNSTRVYSHIFKKVVAVDNDDKNLEYAKETCKGRDNIEFVKLDLYKDEWNLPEADVVFIDAGHTFGQVREDIRRSLYKFPKLQLIIFDDYGLPPGEVQEAINDQIKEDKIEIKEFIGENPENLVHAAGTKFIDKEGVICNVKRR